MVKTPTNMKSTCHACGVDLDVDQIGLCDSCFVASLTKHLHPISYSNGTKSISDDDLCATCRNCDYRPGDMSGCSLTWPGLEDADGYVQKCTKFMLNQRFTARLSSEALN